MTMYRHIQQKRTFGWSDLFVLALVALLVYMMVGLAKQWIGHEQAAVTIDLSPWALPRYSMFSFGRAMAAYFLSLVFSLIYGYAAAKLKRAERVLVPFLDILQSIPVFGFLPSLMIGLSSLFPGSNVGVELACIISIFTSQAWNMTFSFYSSVKTVPSDLHEMTLVARLSWWERFRNLELPFSAIGLAWNSLMSMAGGWFFLTVCESFRLGEKVFELPGIGSYMATAIDRGDKSAMIYGVVAMSLMIIVVDFMIWRPVMAWVRKFQMEEIPEEVADLPFVTTMLRESWLIRRVKVFIKRRTKRRFLEPGSVVHAPHGTTNMTLAVMRERIRHHGSHWGNWLFNKLYIPVTILISVAVAIYLWELVRPLSLSDWRLIWGRVGLTFVRVFASTVVGSLWTIPVAIWIGSSPRLTRLFQPVIQVVASFPAPMVYPLVIAAMLKIKIAMTTGAAVLMMLGIQWYVLFNALAGAMSVPRDLKDTLTMIGASRWTMWRQLYLPAMFPSLVTGWVTAAGGAWNASIVAEYVDFNGRILMAPGIGSMICNATASANFPMLAGCLIAMVVTVVGLNQTWWRWLAELAETRFRFER